VYFFRRKVREEIYTVYIFTLFRRGSTQGRLLQTESLCGWGVKNIDFIEKQLRPVFMNQEQSCHAFGVL
jgi:hypothetical protein